MRVFVVSSIAAALVAHATVARADPQTSFGITFGDGITNLRDGSGPRNAIHAGIRGDLLFLRSRENQMALGPYVEVLTERFNSLDAGGGLEWLLPAFPAFPFVVSAGSFVRNAEGYGGYQPGVAAALFFGPRSFNFDSTYGMANGIYVQTRYGLGDAKQADLLFGIQIDFEILALPWIFTYEAIAH